MTSSSEKELLGYSKVPLSEVEAQIHTHASHQTRRRKLVVAVVGVLVFYGIFKRAVLHTCHDEPLAAWQSLRPHRITPEESEKIFLTIPNIESAQQASQAYATHPHLAGSENDFQDAKNFLHLLQDSFNIHPPVEEPIYPAGSEESRNAILKLTTERAPKRPTAWIDVYYPLLNTPLDRSLHIINDQGLVEWEADLVEDGDPRDYEAHQYRDAVPTWHGLSCAGDVTGELIYANYGTQEDYAQLVAVGTNFTGKIVIARYGYIFRGLKIKGAEELGAAGVLIYSDPRDDGFVTVANGYVPYPAGPARNPTSVQRGSVQYLSLYPGDPTTPGYPAYEDAERTEGSNIPSIPSLPISWANAERLLDEIGDLYVSAEDGSQKLSGKFSAKKVRLVNNVDTKVTPIWNTMAAIPGHIKNEVVVIGCHRDAWVMGAADPISGTISLHEIIKGLGTLLKVGWTPLRTIVIASWDGEEYGLVGSTEWGEDFADWISENVVSYLNVDVSVSGSRWNVRGSPSLAHLIKDVALLVDHPTIPGKKLWDAREDKGPYTGSSANATVDTEFWNTYQEAEVERKASKTNVSPLGSGSDYTVFLQRLGVASTDQGFGYTASDAVYHYHSIYDSPHWEAVYGDPGFYRHVAVAKHLGIMGLRLTDSLLVPLNTTQYAFELDEYLDRIEELTEKHLRTKVEFSDLREAIKSVQTASLQLDIEKEVALKEFERLLKYLPRYPLHPDPHHFVQDGLGNRKDEEAETSVVDFQFHDGAFQYQTKIKTFKRKLADIIKAQFGFPSIDITIPQVAKEHRMETWEDLLGYAYSTVDHNHNHMEGLPRWLPWPIRRFIEAARRVGRANKKLIGFERGFISEGGIKDREWYKHLGVAPGKWLGYGATTLPALTEAITIEKNITLANIEAERLTVLINKLAQDITPQSECVCGDRLGDQRSRLASYWSRLQTTSP